MGVAAIGLHPLSDIAPRASLLKLLEISPGPKTVNSGFHEANVAL